MVLIYPELTTKMAEMILEALMTPVGLFFSGIYLTVLAYWFIRYLKKKQSSE